MKVLIAVDYEANYLTIAGVPVHVSPEAVAAAQQDAQALVRALAVEEAARVFHDQGPEAVAGPPGWAPGEEARPRLPAEIPGWPGGEMWVPGEERVVGASPDSSASVADPLLAAPPVNPAI